MLKLKIDRETAFDLSEALTQFLQNSNDPEELFPGEAATLERVQRLLDVVDVFISR